MMRFAIWAYAAAVALASLAVIALSKVFGNFYQYHLNGKPLPPVTGLLVGFSGWALAIPFLWVLGATWLSRRHAATPDRTFAYAGISTLTIVFLFTFTAVALALPFVTIIVSMQSPSR